MIIGTDQCAGPIYVNSPQNTGGWGEALGHIQEYNPEGPKYPYIAHAKFLCQESFRANTFFIWVLGPFGYKVSPKPSSL